MHFPIETSFSHISPPCIPGIANKPGGWMSKGQRTIVFARLVQDEKKEDVSAGIRTREALLKELPALVEAAAP